MLPTGLPQRQQPRRGLRERYGRHGRHAGRVRIAAELHRRRRLRVSGCAPAPASCCVLAPATSAAPTLTRAAGTRQFPGTCVALPLRSGFALLRVVGSLGGTVMRIWPWASIGLLALGIASLAACGSDGGSTGNGEGGSGTGAGASSYDDDGSGG